MTGVAGASYFNARFGALGAEAQAAFALVDTVPTAGFPIAGTQSIVANFTAPPDLATLSLIATSTRRGTWTVSGNAATFVPEAAWPSSGSTTVNFDGVTTGGGSAISGSDTIFFAHLGFSGQGAQP